VLKVTRAFTYVQAWPRLEYCVDAREVTGIRKQEEETKEVGEGKKEEGEETSIILKVEDEADTHSRPVSALPSSPDFGLDVSAVWPAGRGALLVSEGEKERRYR